MVRCRGAHLVGLFVLGWLGGAAYGEPPPAAVAVDGRAMPTVVIAGDDAEGEARQLVDYIDRITGKDVPVVASESEAASAAELRIHVGRTPHVDSMKLDFDALHPYGYVLKLDERDLVIAGKHTGYAVFDFLTRFAGYRYFMPGDLGEIVPEAERIELPAKVDRREEPSFLTWSNAQLWRGHGSFFRSWRTTALATHNLSNVFPPEEFGESNPEYYPEIDGERFVPGEERGGPWNPCISNPDLPRVALDYARGYFADNPDRLGVSMGVNDGRGDCHCSECLAWRNEYGNQYVPFYNATARLLADEFEDKLLSFIAYGLASEPPRNITLEPNIYVEVMHGYPDDFKALRQWREAGAERLGVYHWLLGGRFVIPRYFPRVMGEAWQRAYEDFNVLGGWMESGMTVWLYDGPQQYVLNELAWDIDADIEALIDDYFDNFYGPAAGPMKAFFGRLEQIHLRQPDPLHFHHGNNSPAQFDGFTRDDLAFLDATLAEAHSAAEASDAPDAAARLELFKKIWGVSRLFIKGQVAVNELEAIEHVADDGDVDRIIDLVSEAFVTVRAIGEYEMSESAERQIFARPSRQGLERYRSHPEIRIGPGLEVQAYRTFGLISDHLADAGDPDVTAFWLRVADEAEVPEVARHARTQVFASTSDEAQENLIPNPTFDPVEAFGEDIFADREDDRLDWRELERGERLPGWGTYSFPQAVTRWYWDRSEAYVGDYSLSVGENYVRGGFMRSVSVEPGSSYLLSFRVRQEPADAGGRMSIRWRRNGSWADSGEGAAPRVRVPYPVGDESRWRKVEVFFTAPDDVTSAMLLLGMGRQGPDEAIWFDDVRLYRVYDPAFVEAAEAGKESNDGAD